jgi:hypothetical protein
MKTIPFDYDKYIAAFPKHKVFTKGGIEVLNLQHRNDREVWKLWGNLATGKTEYVGGSDGYEGWTIEGKFTIDSVSAEMKSFNKDGLYDLVMSDGSVEKVVYNPDLKFKIYNVYHDPARNTVFLDGGFLTPEEAYAKKGTHAHTYLGMFSLEGNPQYDQVFLANGLATTQRSNE